jgi:hypothetical protein
MSTEPIDWQSALQLLLTPDSPLAKALGGVMSGFADAGSSDQGQQAALLRMRERAKRLERMVQALEAMNDLCARALGACPCWGQHPGCRSCGGWGQSGWLEPDPSAFEDLVLPLLRSRIQWVEAFLEPKVTARTVQEQGERRDGIQS